MNRTSTFGAYHADTKIITTDIAPKIHMIENQPYVEIFAGTFQPVRVTDTGVTFITPAPGTMI